MSNQELAVKSQRFYELDSLRGLAALTVVLFHFSLICSPHAIHILLRSPLRLFFTGHQAVILFFLLSGFVLFLPYRKRVRPAYRQFLLKRVCRIYLPYLASLALAVLGDYFLAGSGHYENYYLNETWAVPVTAHLVLRHIVFLGDYDWSQYNVAFWSLVYEMRISLVFPLLAMAVLRIRTLWLVLTAVALSVACFPLAVLLSRLLPHTSAEAAFRGTVTLHYAAFFLIGSITARQLHRIGYWYASMNSLQSAALALVALLLYIYGNSSSIVDRFPIPKDLYDWPIAAGAITIIILAIHCRPFHLFLTSRSIHHLGEISYSLYLIHGTVLFALVHILYRRVPLTALLLLYLGITLAVTEIFYRLIERPTMLLGRRLTAPSASPQAEQAYL